MPSTVQLINKMEMNADGWNRTGEKGLLGILNEAQNILLKQESAQFLAFRTDGKLPILPTTAGVYDYNITQASISVTKDIWRVSNVLVKAPFSNNLRNVLASDYGIQPKLTQPTLPMDFHGVEHFKFHQVKSKDAQYGVPPKISFTVDPGTTTDDFFLLCYEKPTELTSESVNPSVPEQFHYTILLPTALKLLEANQNGNWVEALSMIEEEFKPKMLSALNDAEQGEWNTVARIEF